MTAEMVVLEREGLPAIEEKPAPWHLRGAGYVLIVRLAESVCDEELFVPPSLRGKRHGRTAFLMFVDYQSADCGPYRELLFAPASFEFADGRFPSITRIFVSTYDSVVNGRNNWGIPKDRADFTVEHGTNTDRVTLGRDGRVFASLELASHGLTLPVTSALLPASMRTLKQHWQGHVFAITLKAKGTLRMAKLVKWSFEPAFFPELSGAQVIAGAYLPKFEMTFPLPEIEPNPRI
jgi:Acetoacetate decarboxylase (ADC)